MQQLVAGRLRLYAEDPRPGRAAADFLLGGLAHAVHLELQAQGDAGQRVVAVEHHVLGIDLGHGVQRVARRLGVDAFGQGRALEGHALLDVVGEQMARLQEQQLVLVVAKGVLGLQVQRQRGAHAMALQGLLDARQQVVATHQKLHRIVEHVQLLTQRVLQDPGQGDHTLFGYFHRTIVAVRCPAARAAPSIPWM